ncbi:MAG: hypothetical protein JWL75_488 [Parcubacteria group bacterium]|nr:hypothetical protein [Parcubacteria group bacterium]
MPKQKEVLAAVLTMRQERRMPDLSVEKMLHIVTDIDERLQDASVSVPDAFTRALLAAIPGNSRMQIQERAAYRAALQECTDERQIARRRQQ